MMDVIASDTIGPLPPNKYGNKFILNVIDCFSRFVEMYPIPDTIAVNAANALSQWVSRYGIPSRIVTDNGTQYRNSLITAICDRYNIDHH